MSAEKPAWLTDAVQAAAVAVHLLVQESAAHPGRVGVWGAKKTTKAILRRLCAQGVYVEHPDWDYARQYRLFVQREREALAEAARLAEQAGART
ncbi:hypothetical protein ACIBEJ_34645 [Nonomuraea sp. NPDC050790]|uniref:hypothetical protein n=1 Tax=Nonomuraea sp. NPDC050790 TaxID=3364371 RepID=UPI00379370FE